MSVYVAEGIFGKLADKYKFTQGYPVCDSTEVTLEVVKAMLKQQGGDLAVKGFFDEFRKEFIAAARNIVGRVEYYNTKPPIRPSIINKK